MLGRSGSMLRLGVPGTAVGVPPCQPPAGDAQDGGAAFLAAVAVLVAVAAGAAVVVGDRDAAGSPRDSASSRRRVLIMPPTLSKLCAFPSLARFGPPR